LRYLLNWYTKHPSALIKVFAVTTVLLLLLTLVLRDAVTPESKRGSTCSAVRYTSPACEACTLDRLGNWPKLRDRLLESGCLIYYVQPTPRDRPTPDAAGTDFEVQVKYVSPIFAAETRLRRTPTTFLTDQPLTDRPPHLEVRWQHAGVLSDDNLREAFDAIARMSR
jgi:hypothetical protein